MQSFISVATASKSLNSKGPDFSFRRVIMKKNTLKTLADYSFLVQGLTARADCITDCLADKSMDQEFQDFRQACDDYGWYSNPYV